MIQFTLEDYQFRGINFNEVHYKKVLEAKKMNNAINKIVHEAKQLDAFKIVGKSYEDALTEYAFFKQNFDNAYLCKLKGFDTYTCVLYSRELIESTLKDIYEIIK